MERSKSLPFGYMVAGVGLAGCCALVFITASFYTRAQLSEKAGNREFAVLPANHPRSQTSSLTIAEIPFQLPVKAISVPDIKMVSAETSQQPVDVLKAAMRISALTATREPVLQPGRVSDSIDRSLFDASGNDSPAESNSGLPVPVSATAKTTAEAIEADRQWLMSLSMDDVPAPGLVVAEQEQEQMAGARSAADLQSVADLPGSIERNNQLPVGRDRAAQSIEVSTARIAIPIENSFEAPDRGDLPSVNTVAEDSFRPDRAMPASEPLASDLPSAETADPDTQVEAGQSAIAATIFQPNEAQTAAVSIGDQAAVPPILSLGDQEPAPVPTVTQLAGKEDPQITGWPLPDSLMSELAGWKQQTVTSLWAEAAESALIELNNLRIDDPQSLQIIDYCDQLAEQVATYAYGMPRDEQVMASQLVRLSLRMKRRFAVWRAVQEVAANPAGPDTASDSQVLARFVNQRQLEFSNSSVPAEWVEYLMLDRAATIFSSPRATAQHRQGIARKIMSRVSSTALSEEQGQYARQLVGNELGNALRDAASGETDFGQFLTDLEAYEAGSSALAEAKLNSHFQNYYWSRYRPVQAVAEVFDANYRGANFEIEISDRLINSILPRNMTFNQPVQDRILGAQVFGNSRIHNQLSVELIPDDQHLSFRMISNGRVLSRTRAHASGFVFNSLGNAMVNASKGIAIGPGGVQTLPADVVAEAQSRLINVRSKVDSVPVVGWLARHVAEQKQQQKSEQANQIVEQKLRNEFGNRVDQEIQDRVEEGRQWLRQNIIDPFNQLEVEPTVLGMRTTGNAAMIAYRLAGLDQNASNTVRPQPLPGCLVGAQIHESAINNIINRIEINGETFTAPEFMQHISGLLGRSDVALNAGEHEDVKFQFASRDALRLDFDEDRVGITLRLRRLQIGRAGLWKNLTVTAWYFPQATGLHVDMILDEERGVSLKGQNLNLRDQLTVRTVFNALFKPHFDFPLLPGELAARPAAQGIAVTQIVLVDGWVGLSVSEVAPPGPARQGEGPMLRTARMLQNRWR
jgi:hypothetical protein